MKKVTLGLCEIKSCVQRVENELDLNGVKLSVCSKHTFLSFVSPEFIKSKFFNFQDHIPIQYEALELTENEISRESFSANLRIIKFD